MVPENGYLCIFNIQGKRSITQHRVVAALAPRRRSSSTCFASLGASEWGLDPEPLQSPRLHLQAHKPQGDVEGTKGQASLSLEPQDQLRDRVSPHPLLYRTAAKPPRGWVPGTGSHNILFRPGFLHPCPQGGDPLLTSPQISQSPDTSVYVLWSASSCLRFSKFLCVSGPVWLSWAQSQALGSLSLSLSPLVPVSLCLTPMSHPPFPASHAFSLSPCPCPPLSP